MSGTVKDDGGPAFAAIGVGPSGDVYHEVGMSLRDWFAGQVLAGMCANPSTERSRAKHEELEQKIAFVSYRLADAMLAERSKP